MADAIPIKTSRLSRETLAQFLSDPRAIKEFENAFFDVTKTLPDAIAGSNVSIEEVFVAAENANAKVLMVAGLAGKATDLAELQALSPVPVFAAAQGDQSPPSIMVVPNGDQSPPLVME